MDRRAYLGAVAAGLGTLAGCAVEAPAGTDGTDSVPKSTSPPGSTPPRLADVELPVPRSELTYAAPKDVFPAIVDPVFGEDWSGIEFESYGGAGKRPRLTPEDRVVGVVRDGEARAYPLRVLLEHEIVNDDFGGPLLVSFCHLCGSGVTAERVIDGEAATFGVSGKLWNSDLVMYDVPTESYWSQILATGIRGEHTGDELTLVPSTLTRWGKRRETHPETVVLRPPPESGTIDGSGPQFYATNREAYRNSAAIGVGKNDFSDGRLYAKRVVVGVTHDGNARAYPLTTVSQEGVVNDSVGDLPVVVANVGTTLVAYDRRVGNRTLTFRRVDGETLAAGGSRWDLLSGRAEGGTHQGTVLRQANDVSQLYWFAWAQHHPGTTVYR